VLSTELFLAFKILILPPPHFAAPWTLVWDGCTTRAPVESALDVVLQELLMGGKAEGLVGQA
jgi:hypothetical protein